MDLSPHKRNGLLNDGKMQFLDYLVVVAKYSRLILYSTVSVTVIAYLILFIVPNKYTATARLLPPGPNMTLSAQVLNSLAVGTTPGSLGAVGGIGGLGGLTAGLLGMKTPGDLYVAIMVGNTIFDRIIERFSLRKGYKEKYIEDARKALAKNVGIAVGRRDGLITIQVTDKDRKRAADIANAFAEELNRLLQDLAVQEAKDRLAFLEKERIQANLTLTKTEDALRNFSEKNSVIQIDTQAKEMLLYNARLRAQIDAKEVQIQVLRQQATPYNYDIVRLEAEVNGLKNKLQTSEKQYDQICFGDTCLTAAKVPALGLEYIRLYREVKFQEGVEQLYSKLVELARLDVVKEFAVVQVADTALPPEKRSNKRLEPSIIIGIVFLVTIIFILIARESWGKAQLNEEESQRISLIKNYLRQFTKPIKGNWGKFK